MTGLTVLILKLVAAWSIYFVIHSVLASHWVREHLIRRFPVLTHRYRLYYNILAVILLAPPLSVHYSFPVKMLWSWEGVAEVIMQSAAILALLAFVWSLRYYHMASFLGLSTNIDPMAQRELTISPLHRYVRHPWYTCGLIVIWSRDMDLALLISGTCISVYFYLGAKLEELKLVREFGEAYKIYQSKVPALIPLPWKILSSDMTKILQDLSRATPIK